MYRRPCRKGWKMVSASRLCVQQPVKGEIEGHCCLCGMRTKEGFAAGFSNNFTGYSFLMHGNCLCPWCFAFFKNQDFRKKSWVATEHNVTFLKRVECGEVLVNPPQPPFFIYISKTGQRQGWLSALRYVSYSRDYFCVSTDFVGHFWVTIKEVKSAREILIKLREKKVSKTILRTGEYSMYIYKRAVQEGWEDDLVEIKKWIRKPIWEVMVYVAE